MGRNKLVRPNWDLPWAPELRSILMQTIGVLGRLGEALSDVDGVNDAFFFGSWAARYTGEPGAFPHDVDVVVIGDAALRTVREACRTVEKDLRIEINPIVIDHAQWNSPEPEPFIAQIQEQPLVPIAIKDGHSG